MSKLFYAPKDLNGENIKEIEFNNRQEFESIFDSLIYPIKLNIVYLVAIGDEIYITDSIFKLPSIVYWVIFNECDSDEVFLQEYASYEEAYKSALEMKEESPLCYS